MERPAILDELMGQSFTADEYISALEKNAARWQPIETAPTTGRKVLLSYVNRNHKRRTVMGRWLTDEQAAETDADGVGLEGGWYECIDNWDDYTEVAIHEGEPTHWMPLPAPPVDAALAAEVERLREDLRYQEEKYSLLAQEMVYRGNSVQHWHDKAKAYGDAVMRVWGKLPPTDGCTDVAQAVEDAIAAERRKVEALRGALTAAIPYMKCSRWEIGAEGAIEVAEAALAATEGGA